MNRRDFTKMALAATAAAAVGSGVAAESAQVLPQGYTLRLAGTRGQAELGWLSSRHSFSFGRYYDPTQVGFSDLFVINEDRVQPGRGFGTHPHKDVEIFSYVLEGALEHKDSMGSGAVCRPGDVQFMSAGSGVTHSEFNPSDSEPAHFLQIWLAPAAEGTVPRYVQKNFSNKEKSGQLRLILSRDGENGSIKVGQDVCVFAGLFDGAQTTTLKLAASRHAYIHVARGSIEINGIKLSAGDALAISQSGETLNIANGNSAEVLVFDLRANGTNPLQG
jgi:quercetin 2,3-dioxygenase